MCGIAGIFRLTGTIVSQDRTNMAVALNRQNYRGPDATGIWQNDHVILGHNRLSIIDLSVAANQPYYREDLALRIAFNGEIYNYKALKIELLRKGYEFYTSSDTEVILVAYSHYGREVVKYLVGMFAFIIYDENEQQVFIARDRFGEKPIFYARNGPNMYVASELGSLRELYSGSLSINQAAVVDLMENMYINIHHTIYSEVCVFQPGTSLLLSKDKEEWNTYYTFPKNAKVKIPFTELKKLVKEKLYQVVADELQADVPVATFLSSGVDSSLISAIAKDLKSDITAITMSNKDKVSDESESAADFAKQLGLSHEIVDINPDSLQVLVELLKNMQPLADASLVPSYLVTKQARQFGIVMLSGDGGDEVFGSYERPIKFDQILMPNIPFGVTATKMLMNSETGLFKSFSEKYLNDKNRMNLGGWGGYYQSHNLNHGLGRKVLKSYTELNYANSVFNQLRNQYTSNPERISFGVDLMTRLPSDFLYKLDASAMLNSVEVRAPFLDHTLVDFMFNVETKSMLPSGVDKELTRSILEDFTGSGYDKPKRGFSFSYSDYMATRWGDILRQFLLEKKSVEYFNFNTSGIIEILDSHQHKPNQRTARILFSVLVLEVWLRVFHLNIDLDLADYNQDW